MKVAIIGDGPWAIEHVLKIQEIGGHSVWFNTDPQNLNYFKQSEIGSRHLNIDEQIEQLRQEKRYFDEPIKRITKRFLFPGEKPKKGSRLTDLFRVVLSRSTHETLLTDETKVSQEILDSLRKEIEVYYDFDIILDCQSGLQDQQLSGVLAPAIGEEALQKSTQLLSGSQVSNYEFENETHLLIGSNPLTASLLLKNKAYIQDTKNLFFWCSGYSDPIDHLIKNSSKTEQVELEELFEWIMQDYNLQKDHYQTAFKKWQQLESYEKAKIAEPDYPIPRIVIFSGHSVTAMNKLIDQKQFYVSIEKPEFRESLIQPENSSLVSKTLSVDRVLITTDLVRACDIYRGLEVSNLRSGLQNEPGVFFFSLYKSDQFWEKEKEAFEGHLYQWFSPKENH